MVEATTVRRLLEIVEQRLARLESTAAVPIEVYRSDPDLQDIVERNFEVLIQACIDLALHILADEPQPVPDTNRAAFTMLASLGIIDDSLGDRLEKMAGFRDILAHGYAQLVPEKVHGSLPHLGDIRSYVAQLYPHLRPVGATP